MLSYVFSIYSYNKKMLYYFSLILYYFSKYFLNCVNLSFFFKFKIKLAKISLPRSPFVHKMSKNHFNTSFTKHVFGFKPSILTNNSIIYILKKLVIHKHKYCQFFNYSLYKEMIL